jgi:hypothetical protein
MKKLIALTVFAGLLLSACAQPSYCPAYGTTKVEAVKIKRA